MKTEEMKAKAILVCQDVIRHLDTKIKVNGAVYVWISRQCGRQPLPVGTQVKDAIESGDIPECNACAIGSLLVAHVMRYDAVTTDEIHDCGKEFIKNRLADCFTRSEIEDFETMFYDHRAPGRHASVVTLTALCQNVIDNGGEFDTRKFMAIKWQTDKDVAYAT